MRKAIKVLFMMTVLVFTLFATFQVFALTEVTNTQMLDMCSTTCDYLTSYSKVPSIIYTDAEHTDSVTAAEFYYMMSRWLRYYKQNNIAPDTLSIIRGIQGPLNPSGTESGTIYLADILAKGESNANYIDSNNYLPNYSTVGSTQYSTKAMFSVFARTINWYQDHGSMPSYATVLAVTAPDSWTGGSGSTPTPTPTPDPAQKIKIMIMTRQHGDEPAGTSAIFSYISSVVNNSYQYSYTPYLMDSSDVTYEINRIKQISLTNLSIQVTTLGYSVDGRILYQIKMQRPAGQAGTTLLPNNVIVYFIPMVNPDGADYNERENANGVNLNRDWDDLDEIESRTVHNNAFLASNPEIMLDMHEFTPEPSRPFNMTYCPGTRDEYPNQTPASLRNLYPPFETMVNQNLTNKGIYYDVSQEARESTGWIEGSSIFGGNHFCIKHYAINYTIETKGIAGSPYPIPSLSSRVTMHRTFFETMITYASNNKSTIMNVIAALR